MNQRRQPSATAFVEVMNHRCRFSLCISGGYDIINEYLAW
jgi:hypothetical protein